MVLGGVLRCLAGFKLGLILPEDLEGRAMVKTAGISQLHWFVPFAGAQWLLLLCMVAAIATKGSFRSEPPDSMVTI